MDDMRSMTKLSSDRDSLLALDALLHIRDSIRDGPGSRNPLISQGAAFPSHIGGGHLRGGFPHTHTPSRLPMSMGAGMVLRQSTGPIFPQTHVSALHAAAAAAAAASYRSTTAPPSYAGISSGMNGGDETAARFERKEAQEFTHNATVSGERPPSKASVRKEKVEAALKSKPQRGRKRDNLNVMERLELTRTRNREHAKSTRIRKKQRYQDLLDCEQKLEEVAKAEDLASQRVESMNNYLSIREGMLNQLLGGSDSEPNEAQGTATAKVEYTSLLREVVGDVANFRADIDSTVNQDISVLTRMQHWDQSVASRVQETLGIDAARLLAYKVVGDTDGVAISKDGTGFARVSLVSKDADKEYILILSGILTIRFEPDSSRLCSIGWNTIEDGLPALKQQRMRGNASETLDKQMVYPSVVSLENHKI